MVITALEIYDGEAYDARLSLNDAVWAYADETRPLWLPTFRSVWLQVTAMKRCYYRPFLDRKAENSLMNSDKTLQGHPP